MGKRKDSLAFFEQALRLDANFNQARFNLGVVYLSLNDKESALKQYQILRILVPKAAAELYAGIHRDKILFVKHSIH